MLWGSRGLEWTLCIELRRMSLLGGWDMARTPRIAAFVLFLVTFQSVTIGNLWAQAPGSAAQFRALANLANGSVATGYFMTE